MSEKLCLKWNDFQENVNTAFGSLRGDRDFSDVTLACEDGKQFEAHKVILAASSPSFHHLLKANKHAHPLIYMRGVKSEDLGAIIDFLYCGEANVSQENLDSFLAIAEELKLKGLMGQTNHDDDKTEDPLPMQDVKPNSFVRRDQNEAKRNVNKHQFQPLDPGNNYEHRVATFDSGSEGLKELDARVKSMMTKSQNMIQSGKWRKTAEICKVCGKEGNPQAIKDHIEAKHLEGVSLPCNNCGKTFRSRIALRQHKCKT